MLIVLEGIDGSGKSTLAPLVCDRLRPPNTVARALSKKFVDYPDPYSRRHLARLRQVIWGERKPKVDAMGGEHWALLIAAWYSVLSRSLVADSADVHVSDGWYFRNIIKSIEDAGLDEAWLTSLFDPVIEPDMVVLLDLSPEIVRDRGRRFDHREAGGWSLGGPADFVAYQSRIRRRLLGMADAGGWSVVSPSREETPEAVADRIVALISTRFGWSERKSA